MEKQIKLDIVKYYKNLLDKGLNIGSEGNLSIKLNDKIFITPSGINIEDLSYKKISEVDINGKILNKIKPSTEIDLHLLIYKKKRNIQAIVHSHSDWCSIISCMRTNISSFHYMVAEFGGNDIKCSKYARFGSKKLARNVLEACESRRGCLIANHGQICFGRNIKEAVDLSVALEKLSKQFYFCLLQKNFKTLSKSQMDEVLKYFKFYKS